MASHTGRLYPVLVLGLVACGTVPVPAVVTVTSTPVAAVTRSSPTPTPRTAQRIIADTKPYVVRIERSGCQLSTSAIGSGYQLDATHVVTVAHVVDGARAGAGGYADIAVRTNDRGVSKARVVGIDRARDIALLELKTSIAVVGAAQGLPFATRPAVEGDAVIVFGYPDGLELSSPQGHVVGVNRTRDVGDTSLTGLLQFDAAILGGNSGGPVVSADGAVIGLTESKRKETDAVNLAVTGFETAMRGWLASPSQQQAITCGSTLDAVIDVQSQHAEATGISRTIVRWLSGAEDGYAAMSGTAAVQAGSRSEYTQELTRVTRSRLVLLPTIDYVNALTDTAEIIYQQEDDYGCAVLHKRLTMSLATGRWTVSAAVESSPPEAC